MNICRTCRHFQPKSANGDRVGWCQESGINRYEGYWEGKCWSESEGRVLVADDFGCINWCAAKETVAANPGAKVFSREQLLEAWKREGGTEADFPIPSAPSSGWCQRCKRHTTAPVAIVGGESLCPSHALQKVNE